MAAPLARAWLVARAAAMFLVGANDAMAAPTAFRITDLDLRDPHVFVNLIGCRDFTDIALGGTSFNSAIQARMDQDTNGDGWLDLSTLLVFDPLEPNAAGTPITYTSATCDTPFASTHCSSSGSDGFQSLSITQSLVGTCLVPVPSTVRPYTPAVTTPNAPCFVTSATTLLLDVGWGIRLQLQDAQIGASYSGNPTTALVSGLIRGFLTQSQAEQTLIPSNQPLIGGLPFSSLLRGGTGSCASGDDRDTHSTLGAGWWMYFNFSAVPVSYVSPLDAEPSHPVRTRIDLAPNPSRESTVVQLSLAEATHVRVAIFDLSGRRVASLADGNLAAGQHRWTWNGTTNAGTSAPPGLYVVKASSGEAALGRILTRLR